MGRLPVLWLYGPAGVGKTTVAWRLFTQLSGDALPTGYVDIDQLGMCYAAPTPRDWAPEPASDPGRHRLKARTLDAVLANFRAAGARCVVVSGVVDPFRGADVGLCPGAAMTLCRLRAGPAELRRRLAARGRPSDRPDEVWREADILDREHPTDLVVDTTGRTVDEVVRRVRGLTGGWPDPGARAAPPARQDSPTGPAAAADEGAVADGGAVLWLCGVTAVGKSTVGWEVYRRVRAAGHRAAFVDLDQVGFHRPVPDGDPGNHRLKAANLAAVWRSFRNAGATCLVAVGPVEWAGTLRSYADGLAAATVTVCRLHAGRDRLTERVMLRGRGRTPGWGLAGDELTGRPAPVLARIAERAAADAEALDRTALGDLRVDTDGRPVPDIAQEILARTGWPGVAVPAR
jgi:adenylylsulfate kinase-like enzyme